MKLLISLLILFFALLLNPACKRVVKFEFAEQSNHGGISIRGLSVVNDSVVWISGSKGSYAKTSNGGKNWHWDSIPSATDLDFRDIQAFDENTAIVLSAGLPARVYKTVNGGKSWELKYSDTTSGVFFDSMDFWNDTSGIALSDPLTDGCLMIETHNGGESWNRIPANNFPKMKDGEAHFAASGTCVVAAGDKGICFVSGGSAARVFISNDGGKSWKVSQTPMLQGQSSQGIFSVDIFNEKIACIVGGDYQVPENNINTCAITNDGGKTWKLAEVFPSRGFNSLCALCSQNQWQVFNGCRNTGYPFF